MTGLLYVESFSPVSDPDKAQAMAADLAAADRDAVIYWLRDSSSPAPARRRMGARIMIASVYAQAGILGLVRCTRCGDQVCDWCRGAA